MRVVLQRVSQATVSVDGAEIAAIGAGLLLLVGIEDGDDIQVAERLARKMAEMRIFPDGEGKFNRSLLEARGQALVASQFMLLADIRKGRRPSFVRAASREIAEPLVDGFARTLRSLGVQTQTGRFGAHMDISLVNDGPVTIVADSIDLDRPLRQS